MADVVLDYNQIIEETPITGDTLPDAGGLITFQFKADVNGATDLSNSFFAADIDVRSVHADNTPQNVYIPDAYDFHAFPMLRCFQSVTHIIDGQTVCNSQHPYADALIVEKFLTTHSKANIENFQALSLCKHIDSGVREYNIFTFDKPAVSNVMGQKGGWQAWIYDWAKPGLFRSKYTANGSTASYPAAGTFLGTAQHARENISDATTTMLFQPPFDLWRLRQPFHGGIHQVQWNLKPKDTVLEYGGYMTTSCVGLSLKGGLIYDLPRGAMTSSIEEGDTLSAASFPSLAGMPFADDGALSVAQASALVGGSELSVGGPDELINRVVAAAKVVDRVKVAINRIRFLRRVIRTAVPPQLSNVQYNFTEISMQHGTPTNGQMSQQFLLPSTTFGLIFYWRDSSNSYYDQVGVHPSLKRLTGNTTHFPAAMHMLNAAANGTIAASDTAAIPASSLFQLDNTEFDLKDFQFTYGGATYPMQRVQNISGGRSHAGDGRPYGWHRLMALQNQLQGVYNSTMDDFPQSYGHGYGKGVVTRMDPHMMFFPVSRTGNSDNGILQVEYNCITRKASVVPGAEASEGSQPDVQLVVVALYDAQLNMQYSSNELQQIVLTQFK